MSAISKIPAWQALLQHAGEMQTANLADIVLGDAKRLETCEIALDGLRLNYALNRVTPKTIELLVNLARQQKLEDWRERMFRGEKINTTENRAVLHTALRAKNGSILVDGRDIMPEIKEARERMRRFVADIHEGRRTGATGKPFKHIVNIGIGGSDLGPRLAVQALAEKSEVFLAPNPDPADPLTMLFGIGPAQLQTHFVANADGFDLFSAVNAIDPEETLFVVVSKTFMTQETLINAHTAQKWIAGRMGDHATDKHFVAVSANTGEAQKFGIAAENIFPMWDWVGGRFSLWSAVGLSVALAIGMENFEKMLDGAAAMDQHFREAPPAQNMPILLALLGIWQRNFLGAPALAIIPYSERLRELPRYLQQLEMESNGKSTTRDGARIEAATAPVLFGDCGTVSQHSFHQWLHQGADMVPADIIGVIKDDIGERDHHPVLLANMIAQVTALAFGKKDAAQPYEAYAGGRSSNLILLEQLDPARLGMLLALYEHKVFVQGVIWGINSFDQPGVELGKVLARGLESQNLPEGTQSIFMKNLFHSLSFSKK